MPKRDADKTKAKSPSHKKRSTDAIQMLKDDHRKIESLFERFLEEGRDKKQHIALQIFHELELHSTLEEELFYPALQNQGHPAELGLSPGEAIERERAMDEDDEGDAYQKEIDEDVMTNAYDDHRVVRDMVGQMKNSDASSLEFRQSMIELQQAVSDHVFQEEDELFPQAQLSTDTKILGMRMEQRRQEILSTAA